MFSGDETLNKRLDYQILNIDDVTYYVTTTGLADRYSVVLDLAVIIKSLI